MEWVALKVQIEERAMFPWLILILSTTGFGIACASSSQKGHWPEVQEVSERFHFNDVNTAGLDMTFKNKGGEALYTLECHSGVFEGDSDFNYSGLLACRLVSLYSKERVSTLLTETADQSTDWENRGRYLEGHLLPGCADYPEWGRTRNFSLRGMKLTLTIGGEKFNKLPNGADVLQSYTVNITVKRDDAALTPLAQATEIREPTWFYSGGPCPPTK